jgi:hypothetical protein
MSLFSRRPGFAAPRVFVSYAAERNALAERLALTLMAMGYAVFHDRQRIAAGEPFTAPILDALDRCDLLVFLISPAAVARGHFALSELGAARGRWPHPAGRVLPVMVDKIPIDTLPAYLQVTSILQPEGDVVADTVYEVRRMARALNGQRASSRLMVAARRATMVAGILSMASVPVAQWLYPEIIRAIFEGKAMQQGAWTEGIGMPPLTTAGQAGDTVTVLARCVYGEQNCFDVRVISRAEARPQASRR